MMRVVVAACCAVFAAQSASAQDVADPQLAQVIEAARAKGLPTDPIVAKVRQGVIMHAAPARIVAAAQAVAARMEQARDALAPHPTASDIAAGEDALAIKGVTTDALAAIRAANPREPVAVPVGVLVQLVASGIATPKATQIVTALVSRKATNAQLVALGNTVNGDVARGSNAEASLDFRLRMLMPSLAPPGAGNITTLQTLPGSKKP
jgi:hypothetical protein